MSYLRGLGTHAQTYAPLLLIPRTAEVLAVQVQKQYPTLPHTKIKKNLEIYVLRTGIAWKELTWEVSALFSPLFIEHGGAPAKNDQLHG